MPWCASALGPESAGVYRVPEQSGRRIIVTGATSGLGRETAARLAAAGAGVVLAVRSVERGEAVASEIRAAARRPKAGGRLASSDPVVEVSELDLASLESVRAFAARELASAAPLHGLVNNAGVMAVPRRLTTEDGFELQFGTNFLGPFALTNLLLPKLLEHGGTGRPARVATMSSLVAAFGRIRGKDPQWERGYSAWPAYGQSKLADLHLGRHLALTARRRGWGLLSVVAHPGYTRTALQTAGRNLTRPEDRQLPPVTRTGVPSQDVSTGAEPMLFAAADPAAEQGAYYGPSEKFGMVGPATRVALPLAARNTGVAARLWAYAESATGTALPPR